MSQENDETKTEEAVEEPKVAEAPVEEVKKVTSVEEYRRNMAQVRKVVAPSGLMFEIKRLTPLDYIGEGMNDIPNEFFKFIGELVEGKIEDTESKEAKENFELFGKFLQVTVEKGIVNPPVAMVYEEGKRDTHLLYGELEKEDQSFLIGVVSGRIPS